jgi:hypothetical protein
MSKDAVIVIPNTADQHFNNSSMSVLYKVVSKKPGLASPESPTKYRC